MTAMKLGITNVSIKLAELKNESSDFSYHFTLLIAKPLERAIIVSCRNLLSKHTIHLFPVLQRGFSHLLID